MSINNRDIIYVQNNRACPAGSVGYIIRSGDTFFNLAAGFGISLPELLAANPGVDPNRLAVGQTICIPGGLPAPPVLIPTPFCSLLEPNFSVLPPDADIPIGSVIVRQVAMSTRAYTVVAAPLPNPSVLGNYDTYVGVLDLITDNPAEPRMTVNIRLMPTSFGNQLTTWAGTAITAPPPVVGDFAEIRLLNSNTGIQGPVLLRGEFTPCGS